MTTNLEECSYCSGKWRPDIRGDTNIGDDTDPLVSDPITNTLDVGLGEKVKIVTEDGTSWTHPWCVVEGVF